MPSYLVHFNRLHDKRGRFTYGDGDGDGQRSDISKSARKNPGKSRDQNTGHRRYEKNNTYKRVRLDNGKVPKDWKEMTQREYARALETGNSLAGNHSRSERSFTNQHTGTIKSVPRNITSKFGSTPPKKIPETKNGVGNGRPIGRDYGGTSRGAAAMAPINDTNAVAEELTEDMLEKRKKDEVKDYWQKKYQNAAAKGRSYVDRLFGKETTTNAKSSDKYKKTDNSGNHGKRK